MTTETYIALTGSTATEETIELQIARAQTILETLLGYSLNPESVETNLYTELGKSPLECSCSSVDVDSLLDPDEVVGAYRLYSYNPKDKFLHVDPFSAVHAVKLVKDDVTIKTFDEDEYRADIGRDGVSKYLQVCERCGCFCGCTDCVQLAVDADWLWPEELPGDLLLTWADMITYGLDSKSGIKSETVGPHSWTKFDNISPETMPHNVFTIKKYAGPYGSVSRMPIV